jgi:F0F1-type ATP synthase membrane subunit b/b'
MDILHLVDRLEELFNESRSIWLTRNVIVDEDRMIDIIDQMRVSIPDEIKKAQQLLAQRDRVLAQAQEEAHRIVEISKEKADELVSRENISQNAQARYDQVIAQARAEADAIRKEADDYALGVLSQLEKELQRSLGTVQNGISMLKPEGTSDNPA